MKKIILMLIILIIKVCILNADPIGSRAWKYDLGKQDVYWDSGNVGVGISSPTAALHLKAGSATLAPFKFTAGTPLTIPQSGTLEYDDTGGCLLFTPKTHRRCLSASDDSIIVSSVTTSITNTKIYSARIDADEMAVAKTYRLTGIGVYTTHDAADKPTICIKLNGVIISTQTALAGLRTNAPLHIESIITIRAIGVSGKYSAYSHVDLDGNEIDSHISEATINTTIVNDLTIWCQWDDTLNSLQLDQCFVELLN